MCKCYGCATGGVVVVHNTAVDVSGCEDELIQLHYHQVFNPDGKRSQSELNHTFSVHRKLVEALREHGYVSETQVATSMVALRSHAACKRQQYHTDYDPDLVKQARSLGRCVPRGCLLALRDNTPLEIHHSPRLILQAGDMAVFDGDVCHAGAAYTEENIRVHTYIEGREMGEVTALQRSTFLCACVCGS